jgi:hypothetical protein
LYGFYTHLIAQEREIDTIKTQPELKSNMDSIPFSEWKPNTSVYLELGGNFFTQIMWIIGENKHGHLVLVCSLLKADTFPV